MPMLESNEIPFNLPYNRRKLRSVEEIANENAGLLNEMEKDLNLIVPMLVSICEQAEKEQPNAIVFLDKSARIFAGPIRKFLTQKSSESGKIRSLPKFLMYNDDEIKRDIISIDREKSKASVGISEEMKMKIEEILANFSGKKIFIVDDTFSFGKGLRALLEMQEQFNKNKEKPDRIAIHYFALTYDNAPAEIYGSDEAIFNKDKPLKNGKEFYLETLNKAETNENVEVTPGENNRQSLFCNNEKFQYVTDQDKKGTISLREELESIKEKPNYESSWEKPLQDEIKQKYDLARAAKKRIFERMMEFAK